MLGNYVTPVPAQQRLGPRWFQGSADAIFQSLNLVYDEQPDYVVVFGADHVYRMDPSQMLQQHIDGGAGVTVAGIRVPRSEASAVRRHRDGRRRPRPSRSSSRSPTDPPAVAGSPDESFASMGNYIFSTEVLVEALRVDAGDSGSVHDMGGNIIPMLTDLGAAQVYDFNDNHVPGATDRDRGYWRDVGTLDSYYDAHMDLVSVHPIFNLYNRHWPILTQMSPRPPAKFVEGGSAHESMVGAGSIVAGGWVQNSVLCDNVTVLPGSRVEGSVLMPGVTIGRDAIVRRAILDKNAVVPDGARLGVDLEGDREHYTVSDGGVVVLGKGEQAIPR